MFQRMLSEKQAELLEEELDEQNQESGIKETDGSKVKEEVEEGVAA